MRLVSRLLLLAVLLASALPAWAQASDTFPTGALKEMQIVRNISGGRVTGTKNRFEITEVLSPQVTETPSGCAGDCDGKGTVTVDEILTMVNIALGNSDVSACEAGDANGDAQITVDEILAAVNSALSECGATGTPTPTPAPGCHADAECPANYPYCGPDGNCWTQPCSDVCSDGQGCCGGTYPYCGPDGNCWSQPCATLCGSTCCGPSQQCHANETCLSPQGTPTPTQTPQPSMTPGAHLYCRTPSGGLPIPDGDPLGGVGDTLTIAEALSISDLKVRLQIAHSWVGDLVVTLHHVDTLSGVTLIDRPGVSSVDEFGCDHSNILCTLDDTATAAVDDQCADTDPAIAGTLRPKDPLSTFNGESSAGDWILSVYDESPGDTGNLVSWCLEVNTALPAGISVTVSPTTTSLGQGGTQQFTATVTGTTNTAVTWSVLEGAPGGTITSDGLYTAPSAPGTFHPMAESQADPSQNGIATVVVTGTCSGGVSVTPGTVSLGLGKLQQFTSSAGTATVWSVQEGPEAGLVTSDGLYGAPRQPGTYHVLARSADLTSCGSATVTVVDDTEILETASATIGPTGGAVTLPSGTALVIPAEAVTSPITATLSLVGNDPDFSNEYHLVLDVAFSGDVSSAFLEIPVPAGKQADQCAAAYLLPDSHQTSPRPCTVNEAGKTYTVDLRGALAISQHQAMRPDGSWDNGGYPVPYYGRFVVEPYISPPDLKGKRKLITAPYYQQYFDGACWAASQLDFLMAYNPGVKLNAVYKILQRFGVQKKAKLWEHYFNAALVVSVAQEQIGSNVEVKTMTWEDYDNFVNYILNMLKDGKPVSASFKTHQGLFVGYDVDSSGIVSLIYHDPDPVNKSPYRQLTAAQFRSEFWEKNDTWGRTYVANIPVPASGSPVLQTIHMPDQADTPTWLAGSFSQGIGLARGPDMIDELVWDNSGSYGFGYEHISKDGTEVVLTPSDFTALVIKGVPVWNLDPDREATVTVKTSIQSRDSSDNRVTIWAAETGPTPIPAYDLKAPRDPARPYIFKSRSDFSLEIPAQEFKDKLPQPDRGFILNVELFGTNKASLGYFDVFFPLVHPPGQNSESFTNEWTDYVNSPVGATAFSYTSAFSVTINGEFNHVEEITSKTAIPKRYLVVHAPTSDLTIKGGAEATFNVPSRVDDADFYYLVTQVGETTYRLDLGCGSVDPPSGALTALLTTQCPEIHVSAYATFHFVGYYKPDNSQQGSPFDQPYGRIVLDIMTTSE